MSDKDRQNREKALEAALEQINKKHGAGNAMRLSERGAMNIKTHSTGTLSLDLALGVGGFPRGRVIEIYGPESSGKTTTVLGAIASVQKNGGTAAFIDAEHALDPEWARKIGVDIDSLIISQPDTAESALDIMETLVQSNAVDIIVLDSVAALTPAAELKGEVGDSHMGLTARLMSQALRKIAGTLSSTETTAIFVNQLRDKIGVMFGSPEVTTGGKALKFYSTIRLDVRRIETLKDGQVAIGNRVRIKIVKNKVAAPFKQVETEILFAEGLSREGDILNLALEHNLIKKSGAWYATKEGEQIGQGKEKARQFMKDNPEYTDHIEQAIRDLVLPERAAPAEESATVADEPEHPVLARPAL